MDKRVVITGLGLVTPVGIGVEQTWESLCAGKSGVGEITRFDTSGYQTRIAAEVKDFNPQDFMPKKDANRVEPFIAFALAATRMAIDDAGLVINSANESRVGAITGCHLLHNGCGVPALAQVLDGAILPGPGSVPGCMNRAHGSL